MVIASRQNRKENFGNTILGRSIAQVPCGARTFWGGAAVSVTDLKADVLIVDDNESFAGYVRDAAEQCGRSAFVLTNPVEFKERCKALRPKIVVLDLAMPQINGFQLAQWLGDFVVDHAQPIQLVIVSGGGPDFLRLGRSVAAISGLQDVKLLTKPIEFASLARIFGAQHAP